MYCNVLQINTIHYNTPNYITIYCNDLCYMGLAKYITIQLQYLLINYNSILIQL